MRPSFQSKGLQGYLQAKKKTKRNKKHSAKKRKEEEEERESKKYTKNMHHLHLPKLTEGELDRLSLEFLQEMIAIFATWKAWLCLL